jgi:hypothetical protein
MKAGSDILQQKGDCQISEHTHTHILKGQQSRKSAISPTANCKTENCNPIFTEYKKKKIQSTKGII